MWMLVGGWALKAKPSPAVYYSLLQAAFTLWPSLKSVTVLLANSAYRTRNPIHTSRPIALLPLGEYSPRDSSWRK